MAQRAFGEWKSREPPVRELGDSGVATGCNRKLGNDSRRDRKTVSPGGIDDEEQQISRPELTAGGKKKVGTRGPGEGFE